MEEFQGPHFEPDLIGADGKLSRLHKGGRHKANRLAAQANAQAEAARQQQAQLAAQQQQSAAQMLAAQRAASARESADRQKELKLAEEKLALTAAQSERDNAPAAQYIDDRDSSKRKRRSAFGLSSTRRVGGFNLGGGSSSLG